MSWDDDQEKRCLDDRDDNTCRGPVEFHTLDGLKSWPRCTSHFEQRLRRYEQDSLEKYAHSDLAPSWFDPTYAGERWNDDY